jgi:hypothetical protein
MRITRSNRRKKERIKDRHGESYGFERGKKREIRKTLNEQKHTCIENDTQIVSIEIN